MGGKAALVLILGFGSVLGYVAGNLQRIGTQSTENMSLYHDASASHNLAVTGANVALAKFYQDTSWFGTITQTLNTSGLHGRFTATMTNLGSNRLLLRSISTYNGSMSRTLNDTVEVYFEKNKANSFSVFAWMTNSEQNVYWITGDTVWGRLHSNSTFNISGKPVFMEKVTTTKSFSPKPGTGTNQAIFKKGYETGIGRIDFPTDLSELNAAALNGGRRYTQEIWVTLTPGTSGNSDGRALVRYSKTGAVVDSIRVNTPPFNGVILGTGRVNVQGTLDGQLSIASLTDVYVQDDVLYERNPINGSSDDMLGLIADRNVVVARNTENNNHCEIHASIFTRNGSFMAEDYNTRPVSGELRLVGSIVQNVRGAVGTFQGSTIRSGFSKRYRYDERLADNEVRPPHYPGFFTRTPAITGWWESYRITEAR